MWHRTHVFSVTLEKIREKRCLEEIQPSQLLRMMLPRCWLLLPTLGPATVRRPWNSTSTRRRLTRSFCWPPEPLPPWRIPWTFTSVPAGHTPRELFSSSPGILAAAPLPDVSLQEPSLIRSRPPSASLVCWSSPTPGPATSPSPREATPTSPSSLSATLTPPPSSSTSPSPATTSPPTASDLCGGCWLGRFLDSEESSPEECHGRSCPICSSTEIPRPWRRRRMREPRTSR